MSKARSFSSVKNGELEFLQATVCEAAYQWLKQQRISTNSAAFAGLYERLERAVSASVLEAKEDFSIEGKPLPVRIKFVEVQK